MTTHQILTETVYRIMRPLARVLLRNGVAFHTFAEVAKKAFVDIAFEEFGTEGRKQTISRVSALTGLTRKETKRLHELGSLIDEAAIQRYNRAVRVLSGWQNDPDFRDSDGRPATLPIEGGISSFHELVRRYSGDIPTQAMLAVLEAGGSVQRLGEQVCLKRPAYLPADDPCEGLRILGADTAELIATIEFNLRMPPEQRRFQRKVSNHQIRKDALQRFHALAAEKSQALLEELDEWLARHEAGDDENACYASLGIHYAEDCLARESACKEETP
ncbi:DUF6502 family protein [Thiohalobacter sp. IOR34]|uniref:DUF6502 family protein n=1 Tax=Thiohalobacter sp. IOR34 TaxID=3057176 RepID=UPI0025B147BD|nr:DUF6502 family protein [Thiohalobacter sp. IOR34]WJW74621.1 DUF6502 family protein [Thiohalobacter sp. IOR34]